ncbi:MAG: DnaD domain protein [Ruminococcus sp.]|nr:DnaD domain protein [Ruminococcus sp.]
MNFIFDSTGWGAKFDMPFAVVSRYIKECTGEQLKVLICAFAGPRVTDSAALSQMSGLSEEEVIAALNYWQERGAIILNGTQSLKVPAPVGEETPHIFSGKNEPVSLVESVRPSHSVPGKRVKVNYSNKEIADKINSDKNLQWLVGEIEKTMALTNISNGEIADLIDLCEVYRFDVKTIVMAACYCADAGERTVHNLYKKMTKWHDDKGICSFEDVENEIINTNLRNEFRSKVLRAFGMENKPSTNQKNYISSWHEKGFKLELIQLAYDKCMDNKAKISFSYIDGILNKWAQKGIDTVEKVSENDRSFSESYGPAGNKSGQEHSFDLNEVKDLTRNSDLVYKRKD